MVHKIFLALFKSLYIRYFFKLQVKNAKQAVKMNINKTEDEATQSFYYSMCYAITFGFVLCWIVVPVINVLNSSCLLGQNMVSFISFSFFYRIFASRLCFFYWSCFKWFSLSTPFGMAQVAYTFIVKITTVYEWVSCFIFCIRDAFWKLEHYILASASALGGTTGAADAVQAFRSFLIGTEIF